jgi:hypothetical protein
VWDMLGNQGMIHSKAPTQMAFGHGSTIIAAQIPLTVWPMQPERSSRITQNRKSIYFWPQFQIRRYSISQ